MFVSTIFPLHHMQNGYSAFAGTEGDMGGPCEVYPFRVLVATYCIRGSDRRTTCLCGNSRLFLHFVELNLLKCMKCMGMVMAMQWSQRFFVLRFSSLLSLSSRIQEIV